MDIIIADNFKTPNQTKEETSTNLVLPILSPESQDSSKRTGVEHLSWVLPTEINGFLFTSLRPKDYAVFIQETAEEIGKRYPETGIDFAESILLQLTDGVYSGGGTTKKSVLACYKRNELFGFTVITEKTGRRIKFGPTIVLKPFRKKGIAKTLRIVGEMTMAANGYCISFSTCNSDNYGANKYVIDCGYACIAKIPHLYKYGVTESIYAKKLKGYNSCMNEIVTQSDGKGAKIVRKRGGAGKLLLDENDKERMSDLFLYGEQSEFRKIFTLAEFGSDCYASLVKAGFTHCTTTSHAFSLFQNTLLMSKDYE